MSFSPLSGLGFQLVWDSIVLAVYRHLLGGGAGSHVTQAISKLLHRQDDLELLTLLASASQA